MRVFRFVNLCVITTVLPFGFAFSAAAGPILSVTNGFGGWPSADSSHGLEFTANASIIVTHLGLFDDDDDGMDIDHPIGIFRLSDAALLTSGMISAGFGDTLIDKFRYVDTPDIALDIGEEYVIAYYSATRSSDFVIIAATGLSVDAAITYGPSRRFEGTTGGLVLPINITSDDRIGPNFLFDILEPTTLALVDIKPGSSPNSVNLKSKGVLPVAILGTADFDVNDVDISTLMFGDPNSGAPLSPVRSAFEDVSDDGFEDLSLKFSVADLVESGALGPLTMEGLLTGELLDGTPFAGMDSIRIVPPNGSKGNSLHISTVPEPTTSALALAALCLAMSRRRSF